MLLLWSNAALAVATGGIWSGPASASGSSTYWNPAALANDVAPWAVHAELTGAAAEPQYQRTGNDPRTGEPYEATSFFLAAPDLSLAIVADTPWPWLRVAGGTFSPYAIASAWPEESQARWFATDSYVASYGAVLGVVLRPVSWLGISALGGPNYTALELNSSFDYGGFANARLEPGADLFEPEDPMLEGKLHVRAAGWSPLAVLGVHVEPIERVRFGLGAMLPMPADLEGSVRAEPPPSFDEALPGVHLEPRGKFTLHYPLPLRFHAEAEAELAGVSLALNGGWCPGAPRRVIYPTVTEASHDFLEGRQISVKDTRDDWAVGVRASTRVSDTIESGLRLDFEPRSVPSEALTPVNFDLGSLEAAAGARWDFSETLQLSATLAYRWFFPVTVENSLFNPRAPSDSGLNMPSGNGTYDCWAVRLVLGVAWRGNQKA
jgi:hypothetical protein